MESTSQAKRSAAQPLAGVRVVDLSRMISGPLATCILADQGADVIKIEPPGAGDLLRHLGLSRGGISAIFATANRGKRSLALDLAQERGRALLHQLVREADVFVENFRPGVADALGAGEPELRAQRPDLIYVSITGFGSHGPYASYPAYDVVIQALSGLAALSADAAGAPSLVQTVVCDKVAALTAAQAISAALFARQCGAGGQHLELSLLGATLAFLWPDGLEAQTLLGDGVRGGSSAMRDVARVHATRDGYLALLAVSDEQFAGLCRALAQPDLARDPRFRDAAARLAHAASLADAVRGPLASLSTDEAWRRLRDEGVPAAPALAPDAVVRDPHVLAAQLFDELEHPSAGRLRVPRPGVRFAASDPPPPRPAPALGEHSAEILAELGVSAAEVERLCADGIVGAPRDGSPTPGIPSRPAAGSR